MHEGKEEEEEDNDGRVDDDDAWEGAADGGDANCCPRRGCRGGEGVGDGGGEREHRAGAESAEE